jgi:hypothetical protein
MKPATHVSLAHNGDLHSRLLPLAQLDELSDWEARAGLLGRPDASYGLSTSRK